MEVNLTKSLPSTFRFKLNQTEDVTMEFSYPWLPPRCSRCEKWGHLEDVCVTKKRSPSKVKVVEIEEGEVVEENGLARAESPVSVSGAVRFDSNGKSKEVPQDKTSEKITGQ